MDKQKETIKKMVVILNNASQASAKYFQEEVKKAFKNGEKYLSRRDGKIKSVLEFQAEALVNAGYGDTKQAVREFAEKLKRKYQTKIACYEESYQKFQDDTILSREYARIVRILTACIDNINELVKEVCGE